MKYKVEDLENNSKFVLLKKVSYNDLLPFVLDYIKKWTALSAIFFSSCILFFVIALYIRINISDLCPRFQIFLHTMLGFFIFPLLCIPLHEGLHIVPYYLAGARDIRVGMDLKQLMFYVTAHKYVAKPGIFSIVAVLPFILISAATLFMIYLLPPVWKWSFSLFMFVHATMCAGDYALLNYYFVNRDKKIYTYDDADNKEAFFYQEL
ncbi:MAG TPA: DUF3267 domain-containing protein [Bacteroidales bacterium]|nr:DUF3267 domain-containing protein [Bacteroidales bacterium]